MVCTATQSAVYRQRRPRDSSLYQLIDRYYEEFQRVYAQRYQRRYGFWRPAIGAAVRRFLRCGDPAAGLARIRCPDCGHEMFVAFSCRRRCLCPSCHQKRSLIFGDQVAHEICAPVPHRQYVLTIPKRLRIFFRYDRRLLGGLMRVAWETINQAHREALGRDDVVPGMIAGIQTFGALAHFHPHVHAITTDGAFTRDNTGHFICVPPLDMEKVRRLWEDRVFHLLLEAGKIQLELVEQIGRWKHSGFSVDGCVRLVAGDTAGLYRLAQYMARCPFRLARLVQVTDSGQVIYRAEKPDCRPFPQPASRDLFGGVPRNFQVLDALDFLAEVTQHIPDKGEHLARYYGWYSHRCRGLRAVSGAFSCLAKTDDLSSNDNGKKRCLTPSASADVHIDRRQLQAAKTDAARRRQARNWAALIQRVWEVDPLKCTKCGGQMQIVSLIEARQQEVLRQILEHCGLWQGPPRQMPQPRPPPDRRQRQPSRPREVQLVLDIELHANVPTSRSPVAGLHLVLDPEYLAEYQSEAEISQRAVPYD
jgi:hypothetical protein